MTKRTIKLALGSYVNADGLPTHGYRGDEVDVHEDHVKEFDAANVENGDGKPYEAERVGVDVISPATAADDDDKAAKKAPAKKA